ncbi:hypothetical protein AAHE18_17G081800 [Arachis hypogaea]
MSQNPHICAAWADTGYVQVWDLSSHLNALAESETEGVQGAAAVFNQAPLYKHKHKYEGYAIDWSLLVPGAGRLVSDYLGIAIIEFISGNLRLLAAATWNIDNTPFVGHTASVEDLQWSPTEPHVFASCSVDGSIAIWDTRWGKLPAASFKAHNADVNVMPWNRLASCMFASGSDDGTISIRDLRLLEEGDSVVAHFEYHKHPITSIEWSPHEASSLAVSSSDNQLTIWNLSLEKDEEEEIEFKAQTKEQVNATEDLPPQLLFIHQSVWHRIYLFIWIVGNHRHSLLRQILIDIYPNGSKSLVCWFYSFIFFSSYIRDKKTSKNYIGMLRFLEWIQHPYAFKYSEHVAIKWCLIDRYMALVFSIYFLLVPANLLP